MPPHEMKEEEKGKRKKKKGGSWNNTNLVFYTVREYEKEKGGSHGIVSRKGYKERKRKRKKGKEGRARPMRDFHTRTPTQ